MALDFSDYERDCRSMGGLFQQLSHDMKYSSSVWQDFVSKANKFHSTLGSTVSAMTSFLDAFQKIADMANNSKGAVRDIGGALTKLCLRQRRVELKLKEFITILGGTFSPIPGLLDDWKKTVIQMDHAHGKEYKKLNNEIQKNLADANKLKKQVEKGGRAEKLQPSLDSKMKAVEWKYSDLATNECVSLKKLTLHERQRFSFFVKCLAPLMEKQSDILTEASTLDEIKSILLHQTHDPDNVIKFCEDFVDEFRLSNSDQQQEQQLTFVTPPGTPRCLTRHPSSLSIRSSNSALNQQKRPQSQINQVEQSDRQSVISNSVSTTGAFETDSLISQDTLTREQCLKIASTSTAVSPSGEYAMPSTVNKNNNNASINNYTIPSHTFATFGVEKRSLANSVDSLPHKRQNKPQQNPSAFEDSELLLVHRNDSSRPFNRGVAVRNSMGAPNRHHGTVQPLDSPVRPGRKNDKRATVGNPEDFYHGELMPLNNRYLSGTSSYATLGRSSFKTGSANVTFFGGNFSTGKISHPIPTSPPPPPPPPPLPPMPAIVTVESLLPSGTEDQLAVLLRSGTKKTSAPPPPAHIPASPPIPLQSQNRSSTFAYSPQYSVVIPPQQNHKQRAPHPLSVSIPYYTTQNSTSDKTLSPSSGRVGVASSPPPETPTGMSQNESFASIPIRILRKYPEGLVTPPTTKGVSLETSPPPKPPPPIRNSSMEPGDPMQHNNRPLGRTPSFKQQSAPKDCPPLPKAAPLTIGDNNTNNNNNRRGNVLDISNNNIISGPTSPTAIGTRVRQSEF